MAAAATPIKGPIGHTNLFSVPHPVKQLFKHFPLKIYDAEPLPCRAPSADAALKPRLYVFATDSQAQHGRPSYNPSCLRWQALLRFRGVDFELVSSSNHASPSGALPFLLVPNSVSSSTSMSVPELAKPPLTGTKIFQYAKDHGSRPTTSSMKQESTLISSPSSRIEAYRALLANNIRPAWLYSLYVDPANEPLLEKLYLPSSPLLRIPILQSLRAAAIEEILKTTRQAHIVPSQLFADAAAAFSALSTFLSHSTDDWFPTATSSKSDSDQGNFDAEIFAYTYLILDRDFGWHDERLRECLLQCDNLVQHKDRMYNCCWNQS